MGFGISTNLTRLLVAMIGLFLVTAAVAEEQRPVVHTPQRDGIEEPAWLEGYRFRYALRVAGNPAVSQAKSVMASVPTGGRAMADAGDVVVQRADGQTVPTTVRSHDPAGNTIVQFLRNDADRWYWVYFGAEDSSTVSSHAGQSDPPAEEGLVLELRQWEGGGLDDWPTVVAGLEKSPQVIGNAPAGEILQNENPARPGDPRNFVASYRGYLDIEQAGVYRLFVNSDDAAFVFINGELVEQRPGQNRPDRGRRPASERGTTVRLDRGVHQIEVHHVVGDSLAAYGFLGLTWMPPGSSGRSFEWVPRERFRQPLFATVSRLERAGGRPAADFAWGIDDVLYSDDLRLYLVRFQATGPIDNPDALVWDMGDGSTARGAVVEHVYFEEGDYEVTLRTGNDAATAFHSRVHIWPAPAPTSPFSLAKALRFIDAANLDEYDLTRLSTMFSFALVCEQPERFGVIEKIARHLLARDDLDLQYRTLLHSALMEALARQGRTDESLAVRDKAMDEVAHADALRARLMLTAADLYRNPIRDFNRASVIYERIIDEFSRLNHPVVREAAVRWGDMFAELGDLSRARDAYRLAATLGGGAFETSAAADAVTRGSMLRVAEQKLRAGDIREARRLLEEMEMQFPEQKLEGLYRFLRAETDRVAGRYEEAVRNYEVLLRLRQWSGFHAQAIHGMADAFYRMGELEDALRWLELIEERHGAFYERQNLADFRKLVQQRIDYRREALERGDELAYAGFSTGFELDGSGQGVRIGSAVVMPGRGIVGENVVQVGRGGESAQSADFQRRLPHITRGGYYWVEVWYRETLVRPAGRAGSHLRFYFVEGDRRPDRRDRDLFDVHRTYGTWRKAGILYEAPLVQDASFLLQVTDVRGLVEIDGLTVLPISDREHDALRSFIEGGQTE